MSQEGRLSLGFASPFSARGLDISLNRMSQMDSVPDGSSAFGYALNGLSELGHEVYVRRGSFIVFCIALLVAAPLAVGLSQ